MKRHRVTDKKETRGATAGKKEWGSWISGKRVTPEVRLGQWLRTHKSLA